MKDDCLFCKIANKIEKGKIYYEDDLVVVCLDAFPNVSGHSLIIPKKHYTDVTELPDELVVHIHKIANKIRPMLMDKFNKEGFTTLYNYGNTQIIKHYHLHLMPNNFKEENKDIVNPDEAFKMIKGE